MRTGFWVGRRVLVTGHTGFKGAWLALWLSSLGAEVTGMALPPKTAPSLWKLLEPGHHMDEALGDVRDGRTVAAAFRSAQPECVFHLAAQSLVSRGYDEPAETFAVNVDGTANVLEAARTCPSVRSIVVVTSDKVYAQGRARQPYAEGSPLGGSDPYSASKVCGELVTESYRRNYFQPQGIGVATARAGNVIGGGDWSPTRLVPDVMRALDDGTPLMIRYPDATRPWQHVLDPLRGYLLLAEQLARAPGETPPAVNFGPPPSSAITVSKLLDLLGSHCDTTLEWQQDTAPKPLEAPALVLSSSLAADVLGWRPVLDLDQSLAWTAQWYRAHRERADLVDLTRAQIKRFECLIER